MITMNRRLIGLLVLVLPFLAGAAWADVSSLVHHDVKATFDAANGQLQVNDRITAKAGSEIRFRLAHWLAIDSAEFGGDKLTPRAAGGSWHLTLPPGPAKVLTLSFSGTVPALTGGPARGAVFGPEGGYLPGHAAWIPDFGGDWMTYRLAIDVLGGQLAVATGRLESEQRDGGVYRANFLADYPAEAPSVFLGPFSVRERHHGAIRLRTYFHADIASFADTYLDAAAGYLSAFAERIGAYPFADFHVVSSPLPVGLGFPNLTYVGRMIVPLPFMRGRSLAHEVLHTWWGNGVVVDYAKGNWAEGLTTYMADYALAARRPEGAREMRLGWLRDFAALPVSRDKPVTSFVSKTHQASQVIGYGKVAFIFHMLRRELGDDVFDRGLKRFWARHKFQVAGWDDLRAAFEAAAGKDLAWFFRQWLGRAGAARIELTKAEILGAGRVAVTLRQDDPTYRAAVDVELETTEGASIHTVDLRGPEVSKELSFQGRLVRLRVDPHFNLFRRLLAGESPPILRDVTLSRTAAVRVLSPEPTFRAVAARLAARLFGGPRHVSTSTPAERITGPTLLIGPDQAIQKAMRHLFAAPPPNEAKGGTAGIWVMRTPGGHPVLFVRARDADAVQGLVRPLPHYGRQSYLTFDAHRMKSKGIWEATASPLTRRFEE